jgi:hypothetical protein
VDGGGLGFARSGGWSRVCTQRSRGRMAACVERSTADGGVSRGRTVQIATMGRSVGGDS